MNPEITQERVKELLLGQSVIWEELPGPEGFPLVRCFRGLTGPWRFLVAVGPMEEGGNPSLAGTATFYDKEKKEGILIVLPTPLVALAFTIAAGKNKPEEGKDSFNE